MSVLQSPEAVRALVSRRYRNHHRTWLAGQGSWPLQIPLGCPTEQEAHALAENISDWVGSWRCWPGPGEVVWCERRWHSLGTHRLPEYLIIQTAADAAFLAGDGKRWDRASKNYAELTGCRPLLASGLARWYEALAGFDAQDMGRLHALIAWLEASPRSNLFPRQVPIPGMDTKWLEPRLAMVADLLSGLRSEESGRDVYERCGLMRVPQTARIRVLDYSVRRCVGGLSDITAPVQELRRLDLQVRKVYIVENLQTGLAFGDEPGAVVVMGLGYGVTLLAGIPWIDNATCIYWGDLDTHGFAILNQARSCLNRVDSMLMDETTLLRYRDLWVTEREQCAAADPPLLTYAEQVVYQGLKKHRWGFNVRLEQERIPWNEIPLDNGR